MPCPAVRECRWLAPSVCTPKCLPCAPPLFTTTFSTPHWSQIAICLLIRPCQDSLLLLQGSLQYPSWDSSLAWVCFWCYGLYVFPKFSCQDFKVFSPNLPSSVPRMRLNLIPLIPGLSMTALLTLTYSHPISTCSPKLGPSIFPVEGAEPDRDFLI